MNKDETATMSKFPLKRLLGVRFSLAKYKIIRAMVEDWYTLMAYQCYPVDEPSLRDFVEEQFEYVLEQARICTDWREFYKTYKYQ